MNVILDVDCSPNSLLHGNYPGDWNETERFSDGSTRRVSAAYPQDPGDWPGTKMVGWKCPRGGTLTLLRTSPPPGGRGLACGEMASAISCAKRRDAQGNPMLESGAFIKESCVYDSGGEKHVGSPGPCAQDNCAVANWACCIPCGRGSCEQGIKACCGG